MKSETLKVQPKLKVFAVEILLFTTLAMILSYLLIQVPKNGIYIYQIFDIKNQWIRSKLIDLLRYKITYSFIAKIYFSIIAILFAFIGFYWLKVKTTTYTFTNKYLDIAVGVLSRTHDNVDMVDIRDQILFQNIINRIVGVSQVTIISNDKTHPRLLLKLAKPEADLVMEFLRIHSTRSIVDYQLSRDLKGVNKNKTTMMIDEGGDGDSQ